MHRTRPFSMPLGGGYSVVRVVLLIFRQILYSFGFPSSWPRCRSRPPPFQCHLAANRSRSRGLPYRYRPSTPLPTTRWKSQYKTHSSTASRKCCTSACLSWPSSKRCEPKGSTRPCCANHRQLPPLAPPRTDRCPTRTMNRILDAIFGQTLYKFIFTPRIKEFMLETLRIGNSPLNGSKYCWGRS